MGNYRFLIRNVDISLAVWDSVYKKLWLQNVTTNLYSPIFCWKLNLRLRLGLDLPKAFCE